MPASPGYPFIPGGAPAVFRNTIRARMCIHAGGFTASARGAKGKAGGRRHRCVLRGFARVARRVCALAPALRVHAWPDRCERAGYRDRGRVPPRVVAGWLPWAGSRCWEQCAQCAVSLSMRRVCASGEAQRVSIIPRARAREMMMCRSALSQAGSRRLVVGVGSSVCNVQCHLACGKRACWVRCISGDRLACVRAGKWPARAAVAGPASGRAASLGFPPAMDFGGQVFFDMRNIFTFTANV